MGDFVRVSTVNSLSGIKERDNASIVASFKIEGREEEESELIAGDALGMPSKHRLSLWDRHEAFLWREKGSMTKRRALRSIRPPHCASAVWRPPPRLRTRGRSQKLRDLCRKHGKRQPRISPKREARRASDRRRADTNPRSRRECNLPYCRALQRRRGSAGCVAFANSGESFASLALLEFGGRGGFLAEALSRGTARRSSGPCA